MERIERLAQELENQGYDVKLFSTKEEAAAFLDSELDGTVIGIGGSQTVGEMGLYQMLLSHNEVHWHYHVPEGRSVKDERQAASRAPVYISSVNAISESGDIINIDGTGNRVAAISYGPDDVYFVVGRNKITEDYESALFRARNVAAPLNAKRLKVNTPCAVNADRCYDCSSPERICRNFSIIRRRPTGINYHVILINEDLGF